jgi:hypothetical protein
MLGNKKDLRTKLIPSLEPKKGNGVGEIHQAHNLLALSRDGVASSSRDDSALNYSTFGNSSRFNELLSPDSKYLVRLLGANSLNILSAHNRMRISRIDGSERLAVKAAEIYFSDDGNQIILKWPDRAIVRSYDINTGRQVGEYRALSKFFRESDKWADKLDRYLIDLVASRITTEDRTLRALSLGSGSGEELFSIAIVINAVLQRFNEDPAKWDVSIEGYDANPLAAAEAHRGVYLESVSRLVRALKAGYDPGSIFELRDPDALIAVWTAREPFRSWVRVKTCDLTSPSSLLALSETSADILFIRYLTMHLNQESGNQIYRWACNASWSREGTAPFLSYADPGIDETYTLPVKNR